MPFEFESTTKQEQTKTYKPQSDERGFHQFVPPTDEPSFFLKKFIKSTIKGMNEILDDKGYPPGSVISFVSIPKAGKCVAPNTYILLSNGDYMTAEEAYQNHRLDIVSWDENNLTTPGNVKLYLFKEKNKMIKIKTRTGREIIVTPEHPLYTDVGWLDAEKIKEQETYILTPKSLPIFGKEEMPEYEAKIIGYMLGDGHCDSRVSFTNTDKDIVQDFSNQINILWNSKGFGLTIKNYGIDYSFSVSDNKSKGRIKSKKNPLNEILRKHKLMGLLSRDKFIPMAVFRSDSKTISTVLQSLLSCDGSVDKEGHIYYYSISKVMATQVQHLLLRFGIRSQLNEQIKICYNSKTKATAKCYIVSITDSDSINLFSNKIGFIGMKHLRLKRMNNSRSHKYLIPYSFIDKLKIYNVNINPPSKKKDREGVSEFTLLKYCNINLPFYFDLVISVEELKYDGYVYDFNVPNLHNFIANDFINHNTTACLHESINMASRGDDVLYMYNESIQEDFMLTVDKARKDINVDSKAIMNSHLTFLDRHSSMVTSANYNQIESFVPAKITNPIKVWLESHNNPKLIVVDSLTKFIRKYPAQAFVFAETFMYELKSMFDKSKKKPVVIVVNQKASGFDRRDDESVLGGLGIVHDMDGSFVIRTQTVDKWLSDETGLERGSKLRLFRVEDIRIINADTRERRFTLDFNKQLNKYELILGETLEELTHMGPQRYGRKKED